MNASIFKIFVAVALGVIVTGCGPMFRWTDSGIPKALDTETLLRKAGTPQGMTLGGGGSSSGQTGYAVETEREFHATILSGTPGQLVAAYRGEVRREIERKGGTIQGEGVSGRGALDVEDFSYSYKWGGNVGIVRVYSFAGTNGELTVISFCYEHRR